MKLEGPMNADDLGPGTNPARLQAIRDALHAHSDSVPVLLMPVRIETRFFKVQRIIPGKLAPSVADSLGIIERAARGLMRKVAQISRRPVTFRPAADGKRRKQLEREAWARLDEQLDTLHEPLEALARIADLPAASPAELERLSRELTTLKTGFRAIEAHIGGLHSAHERARLIQRTQTVREATIDPLLDTLNAQARHLNKRRALTTHAPRVLARAIDAVGAALPNRRGEPSIRQATALFEALQALKAITHVPVEGTREAALPVLQRWAQISRALARFNAELARLLQDPRARRIIHRLESVRVHLDRRLSPQRLIQLDTAQLRSAYDNTAAVLEALDGLLGQIRDRAWGRVLQATTALNTSLARITLIPSAEKRTLVERAQTLEATSARLAAGRPSRAQAHAHRALTALKTRAEALSADQLDAFTWPGGLILIPDLHAIDVHELRVRIYPDDLFVHTHETGLTADEIEAGRVFWQTHHVAQDERARLGAWRALCRAHGTRRAAWIARTLTPLPQRDHQRTLALAMRRLSRALQTADRRLTEILTGPGLMLPTRLRRLLPALDALLASLDGTAEGTADGVRQALESLSTLEARLRALLQRTLREARRRLPRELARALTERTQQLGAFEARLRALPIHQRGEALLFPAVVPKDGPWTQAPHARTLPNQFVAIGIRDGQVKHIVVGEPIPTSLLLGLDPNPDADATEQFELDDEGNLIVGDSIRWMTQYGEAVGKGMGITIPLDKEDAREGFDELFVLGIRDTSPAEGARLIKELFDNHRYSPDGMAFLPIGTPTNNTRTVPSGHTSEQDADAAWATEMQAPLFNPATIEPGRAPAGLRLARALGLSPDTFAHTEGATGQDVSDSLAMNRALWPATIGRYLEDFFGPLFPLHANRRTQAFFEANVSARGLLPSIRLGDQPYGILPVTALHRLQPEGALSLPPPEALGGQETRWERLFTAVLLKMHQDWDTVREARVAHAHREAMPTEDAQQHFLNMIGVHPSASSFVFRHAVNAGSRNPAPPGDEGSVVLADGTPYGPHGVLTHFEQIFRAAWGIEAGEPIKKAGSYSAAFTEAQTALRDSRAFGVRYIHDTHELRRALVGSTAELQELLDASVEQLMEDAYARPEEQSLLSMLIRHALLSETLGTALDILEAEGMMTEAVRRTAGSSDAFIVHTLTAEQQVTKWNYLFGDLTRLDGRFGLDYTGKKLFTHLTTPQPKSMAKFLDGRGTSALFEHYLHRAALDDIMGDLTTHADAVQALTTLQKPQLTRLLGEHLDLCSYRLDAWLSGFANRALSESRAAAPQGIHLGAFGWVESLRPGGARDEATDLPAELHRVGEAPVYTDADNQGFVHAPSIAHAIAAAVLRGGYLVNTTSDADEDNKMAVNISSRRVRLALQVIDGIRGGHTLGALLGYTFERTLHEAFATDGVELDAVIAPLRRLFPSLAAVNPANPVTDEQRQRQVVDGLTLLDEVQAAADAIDPDQPLPTLMRANNWALIKGIVPGTHTPAQLEILARAIDTMADTVDALSDLMLSESVYQIARGNRVRAAAVLQALAEGRTPPRPEFIDTPRGGTVVTQRPFLMFEAVDGSALSPLLVPNEATRAANIDAIRPVGWQAIPMTTRALTEPALNRYLGALLGDPSTILCQITGGTPTQISVADLQLQPLDLLAALSKGLEEGEGELIARVLRAQLKAAPTLQALNPWAEGTLKLVLTQAGPDLSHRSLLEISALLEAFGDLLSQSRPADAHDLALEESTAPSAGFDPPTDWQELEARVRHAHHRLHATGQAMLSWLADGGAHPAADTAAAIPWIDAHQARLIDPAQIFAQRGPLMDLLNRAAEFGISGLIAPPAFAELPRLADAMATALGAALRTIVTRLIKTNATLDALTDEPGPTLRDALEAMFDAPTVVPRFRARNPAGIEHALNAGLLRAAKPTAMHTWLQGVAKVRPAMSALEEISVLAHTFGTGELPAQPAQLPPMADAHWLGIEQPAGTPPAEQDDDVLSLVFYGHQPSAADPHLVGLRLDEWHEIIPRRHETTAVSFFYDQPDAAPPQALLLAVSPRKTGHWDWDDLVHTLHDTLAMARNRTVEPEHLEGEPYAQLLPALLGEIIPQQVAGWPGVEDSRAILEFWV
jgi:hypothetical protein